MAATQPWSAEALGEVVGKSDSMRQVLDQIQHLAGGESVVLLVGEPGTGKEWLAEEIHRGSSRAAAPYVAVHMADVPEAFVDSELFGHEKEAVPGASSDRPGRFEIAHHGTLFLDEIGDLKRSTQAKLLRAIEHQEVTRVGGTVARHVDVRVVAATSRDLDRMVAEGRFRDDLACLLQVAQIVVPPLRERRDDILYLADLYLHRYAAENGIETPQVHGELADYLVDYSWPGNVRQLRSAIESMVVMARGDVLTLDDLPRMIRSRPSADSEPSLTIPPGLTLGDLERIAIRQTLDRLDGNRTKAAQALGISVRTLQRKLKRWQAGTAHRTGAARADGPEPSGSPNRPRWMDVPPSVVVG